jgi:hydroxypyruvate reductase
MVAALEDQVGSRLEGIVASSVQPASQVRGFRYFQGGHPTPTAESLHAADAILKSLNSLNAASLVIFMLSGGGSSIVETPMDDEITFPDLAATYRVLVHSGAPFRDQRRSQAPLGGEGWRARATFYPGQQVDPGFGRSRCHAGCLASGPTMPDSTSIADCERIVARYELLGQFEISGRHLSSAHTRRDSKSDDPAFVRARWWTVLSNKVAVNKPR